MIEEKRSIKKSTAQAICDAVKVKEGATEGVPFNEVAKRVLALPTASGENKLAQLAEGTLTEITAEDLQGVTKIRRYCFSNSANLIYIELPSTITSIQYYAFNQCSNLKNVYYNGTISDWVKVSLDDSLSSPAYYALNMYFKNAFGEYEAPNNLIIPEGVTTIGNYTFYLFKNVLSITIPNSCIDIGKSAFAHCEKAEHLNLGNGVQTIQEYAFEDGKKIESVIIPNSTTTIGNAAFRSCSNLRSVRIGNGISNLPYSSINSCFYGCNALTDIYIDAPEGSISGSPWGASSATVHWNTPLPSEEV